MSQFPCELLPNQTSAPCAARPTAHTGHSTLATLVSVCIVNWNCRALLADCLRSLLQQPQGVEFEVIVVDNASTDGAAALVVREFPQVRLIENVTNLGFARANNQAAALARGPHLFFLNNDTVMPPFGLMKLTDFLEGHPEAILAGPALRDADGKIQISYRRRPTVTTFLLRTLLLRWTGLGRAAYQAYRRGEHCVNKEARAVDVLMGAALMIRRDDFFAMGGWDEDFVFGGEDLDLCHRAGQRGRIFYVPQIEIMHLGRASTRQNVSFAFPHIAGGFARYFRKSGASPAALFVYKLVLTLDAPLQIVVKASQYLVRRLRGRGQEAEQSWTAVRSAFAFLSKGLRSFWRA